MNTETTGYAQSNLFLADVSCPACGYCRHCGRSGTQQPAVAWSQNPYQYGQGVVPTCHTDEPLTNDGKAEVFHAGFKAGLREGQPANDLGQEPKC